MKTALIIIALAATALSGCQTSGTPTATTNPDQSLSSGPGPTPAAGVPPSTDTINNPPSTVSPPAPGTQPGNP
jgi:hypothetical protein